MRLGAYVHIGRELAEGLVKVVHLHQNADGGDDHEDVSRRVTKLVVTCKGELQGDTKCLDRHDRDGADERADP